MKKVTLIIGIIALVGSLVVLGATVLRVKNLQKTVDLPKADVISSCTGTGYYEVGWCGAGGGTNGDTSCGCGAANNNTVNCKLSSPPAGYKCTYSKIDDRCLTNKTVDCTQYPDTATCAYYKCAWTTINTTSCTNPFSPTYNNPSGTITGITPTFNWTWCDPTAINSAVVYLWKCNSSGGNCSGAWAAASGTGKTSVTLNDFTIFNDSAHPVLSPNTQYWWSINPNSCATYPSENCPIGSAPGTASFTTGANAQEICWDGIDNNGNGQVDEGCVCPSPNACPTGKVCNSSGSCVVSTVSHLGCGTNNTCITITGAGNNTDGCVTSGQSCTASCQYDSDCPANLCVESKCATLSQTHLGCGTSSTCVRKLGAGNNTENCTAVNGTCTTTTCATGQISCNGVCKNLQTDTANCGVCGNVCTTGQVCSSGSCTSGCSGTTPDLCGTACTNKQTDNSNCGTCGNVCTTGQVCTNGTCANQCAAGQNICSGVCKNLQTDSSNCGTCGNACATGKVCSSGVCTTNCTGTAPDYCGTACTNKQTDSANCGACGTTCTTGQTCSAGVCGVSNEINSCWGNLGINGRCYDCNGDGTVNALDFACFRARFAETITQ